MRNLRQRDHSIEQFTSKHKRATQKWEINAKGVHSIKQFTSKYKQATQKWEIYAKT